MSEIFREGNETDADWTYRYEILKTQTPVEIMGRLMRTLVETHNYSIDHARTVVKNMLQQEKQKSDVQQL